MGLTRLQASTITDSDFKTSCKVATQTNITNLTTGAPNSVDGVNLSVGDRVLVRAQNNAAENGIYTVASVGTGSNGRWARATDFKDNVSISSGSITFVENGASANTFYYLAGGIGTVTVGSTNFNFRSFSVTPPGSNTQILFNNNGEFGANSNLTWNGANLAITGNILANGFYFSNGSPFTVDSTQILNGNSNVKVTANSDISVSVAGNSNVVVVTGTGANINGYANVTGDTTVGGNLTVTGDFTVNGTTTTLNTSTLDIEDLNITLAKGAVSSAAANGAGITIDGASATFVYSSITNTWVSSHGANITGSANITGNANVGNLGATTVVATDLTGNLTTAAQPNITSVGTLSSVAVSGNANVGNLNSSNKVVASTLESNVATGTAPLTVVSTTQVANLNVANAGHSVTANTVVDASQPNITGVGTLSTLNVSGNANTGNLGTAQVLASANITTPQFISNIATGTAPLVVSSTTQVANLNVQYSGNAVTANTVVDASQPNITSVGTLSTLSVSGNANTGNLGTGTVIATTANLTTINSGLLQNGNSNIAITANGNLTLTSTSNSTLVVTSTGANIAGTANVTGNAYVGNIIAGGFYFTNGSPFTVDATQILNGNSNVTVAANSNVTVSVAGNANIVTVTGTGANISGTANITGNVNVGNIGGTTAVFTDLTGTLTTAAQPNITSVGTLSSLTVTGNVSAANLVATGDLYLSGNDIRSSTGNVAITLNDKDVTVVGNLAVQGLTTTIGSQNYSVQDSIIDLHTFPNLAPLTADDGRDIGIRMHYFKSTTDKHAFLGWANDTGALEYYSDATESSGVISGQYGTIKANLYLSEVTTGTAPLTVKSTTQVANLNAQYSGNAVTANTVVDASQPNITSVGTLSSLNVNGTVTSNTFTSNIATGTAPFTVTSTTRVANLNVANAGYADTTGSATSATTAGTVTTASQPNITSVGTLSSLSVTGNTSTGGILTNNYYYANGTPLSFGGASLVAQSTAPSTPSVGDYWYDTDTGILYLRINDGTSDLWLDISTDLTARLTASATTPSSAALGDIWYDTATDIIFQYISDGTSNVWVDISSTGNTFNTITSITANLTTINATTVNITGANGTVTANTYVASGARTGNANVSTVQSNFGGFRAVSSTYTDNSAAGGTTIANAAVHALGTPTLAAANASVTMTNAATFYIQNAPTAGSNVTLSNSYALYVGAGNSGFGGNIVPTANAVYNLGSLSNQFSAVYATTFTGTATTALYADLAENYKADSRYEKGSVVVFGGAAEITATDISHDARVAGVISTAPAYLMNNANVGDDWLPVALTGRVPCFVQGPVKKGDILVTSNQPGVAEKLDKSKYEPGCVIGKALEDHAENTVKTIEVVVGRF